ncbi:hypothetical protein B0H10DRAFT_2314262, partial [Mycena sp. CBHHK59/15]
RGGRNPTNKKLGVHIIFHCPESATPPSRIQSLSTSPNLTSVFSIMDPAQYPQHGIDLTQRQHYPELDIDAVLSARMNDMALKYEAQLDLFKSSLRDQFTTATQQSNIENGLLREELARLRALQRVAMEPDIEMAETAGGNTDKHTRDPRPRPSPAQPPIKDPQIVPKSASPGTRINMPAPTTPCRSPGMRPVPSQLPRCIVRHLTRPKHCPLSRLPRYTALSLHRVGAATHVCPCTS